MRNIERIIIHCSATPEGREHDVEDIRRWHVDGRGWSDVGYHFVVKIDGTIERGRPLDRIGSHCRGKNQGSIGVCYVGGMDKDGKKSKDTRTNAQKLALIELVESIKVVFGDDITVHGHDEFTNKACPSFDVQSEF